MHYQKRRKEGALFWTYFSTKKNAKFFGGFRSLVVACCAPEYKDMKKNRKTHPKNIVFYITQNLLGLSKAPKKRRRRRRTGNRPHSSNRPTTTARGNPCFFDARARERERERRFPPRVSLSNAPDSSSHPFSSPPNTSSVGFKFSIETPTTLPVAVAR